jgi:hypothetical protein
LDPPETARNRSVRRSAQPNSKWRGPESLECRQSNLRRLRGPQNRIPQQSRTDPFPLESYAYRQTTEKNNGFRIGRLALYPSAAAASSSGGLTGFVGQNTAPFAPPSPRRMQHFCREMFLFQPMNIAA